MSDETDEIGGQPDSRNFKILAWTPIDARSFLDTGQNVTLSSSFDLLLDSPQPLRELENLIWQHLQAAAGSSDHPWNLASFSTIDSGNDAVARPKTRTVVLREVDHGSLTVDFYTDVRSEKVRQVSRAREASPVSWLFYERSTKIQLRLDGHAEVINDERADAAWMRTTPDNRASYLSIRPPGERHDDPHPPATDDRFVPVAQSSRGRTNFRIIRTTIQHVDWLYLRNQGHVRATIDYDTADEVDVVWVVP